MRILVVTDFWFPDYVGGSARVARDTAVALAGSHHEVVALAPATPKSPPIENVSGVIVKRSVRRHSILPRTLTNPAGFRDAARRELEGERFDVILAHHPPGASGVLQLQDRPPLAYVFHASPAAESRYRREAGIPLGARTKSLLLEPAFARLERSATCGADRILVLSEFSRCLAVDGRPDAESSVAVVGGGVDVERFSPPMDRSALRSALGVSPNELVILTVRRLVNRMGLDRLLYAFQALAHDPSSRLRLVIIGDGEERERLIALAKRLGISDRASFRGRLPDAEVISWYRAADLFVLPTAAYEGFGMVSAEALACGTPVVGTAVGAIPEVLRPLDPDLIAPSASADDLAGTILRILPRLKPSFRQQCRAFAERQFDWSRVIETWALELETTAGGNPQTQP